MCNKANIQFTTNKYICVYKQQTNERANTSAIICMIMVINGLTNCVSTLNAYKLHRDKHTEAMI